jgi:hypothetical protein
MPGKPAGWVTTFNAGAMTLPGSGIFLPYWSILLMAIVVTGTLWGRQSIPTRFKLRTLLIATTLIAVLLGLAVWASN